jgi:hypothetical protein
MAKAIRRHVRGGGVDAVLSSCVVGDGSREAAPSANGISAAATLGIFESGISGRLKAVTRD